MNSCSGPMHSTMMSKEHFIQRKVGLPLLLFFLFPSLFLHNYFNSFLLLFIFFPFFPLRIFCSSFLMPSEDVPLHSVCIQYNLAIHLLM